MPSTQSGSGMELFGRKITNGELGLAAIGLFAGLTMLTRMSRAGGKQTEMLKRQAANLRRTEQLREQAAKKLEREKKA